MCVWRGGVEDVSSLVVCGIAADGEEKPGISSVDDFVIPVLRRRVNKGQGPPDSLVSD